MSNTLFKGTLTLEKLKELCYQHLDLKSDSDEYNPKLNPKVISILALEDGSFRGETLKNGKLITSREIAPEHALQALLTHNGI